MKRLSLFTFLLGLIHLSFWKWAPWIAEWQNRRILARYDSVESLGVAMQVFNESMQAGFLVAAALGVLMLIASLLIYKANRTGWWLWLATITVAAAIALLNMAQFGPSVGNIARLTFLAAVAYVAFRLKRRCIDSVNTTT